MNGRVELEEKINYHIDEVMLKDMPQYLIDFRHSLASNHSPQSIKMTLYYVIQYLKKISDNVNETPWEKITQGVSKFFSDKRIIGAQEKRNSSSSYQIALYYALKKFFTFAKIKKYISENPMDTIEKPKDKGKINRIHLHGSDFKNILTAIDNGAGSERAKARQFRWKERDELILQLFMTCGMRKSALTSINVEDIDFEQNILTLTDKGNEVHEYDVSNLLEPIKAWLYKREQILEGKEVEALFISNRKQRISVDAVEGIVAKYSQEGINNKLTPHDLRAGLCTILAMEEGKDIKFVADVIGHKDIKTTQRYIITDKRALKKESAGLMAQVCGLK